MKVKFQVTGMTCAACSARVEKVTKAVPGVHSCEVNLLAGSMTAEAEENARDAIIRAVTTKHPMSATIEEITYAVLHKIVNRITSEVPGINRVLYDLTPKPTGTIEWE